MLHNNNDDNDDNYYYNNTTNQNSIQYKTILYNAEQNKTIKINKAIKSLNRIYLKIVKNHSCKNESRELELIYIYIHKYMYIYIYMMRYNRDLLIFIVMMI